MLIPFSPPPGLNSDDTSFAASGQWTDGDNVRFSGGRAQPIGGASGMFAEPALTSCRDLFAFTRSGATMIAYGSDISLHIGDGLSGPADRSPIGFNQGLGWSFAAWGDTLLAAVRGGTLHEQSGTAAATEVATAPDRIDAGILVTPERQLLAFGCNEEVSGTFNALCIRGSDIEDYADWTTSPSNNAFEHVLPGPGAIVAAAQIGPYVAVWTNAALHLGQFVGDPGQTYRFDRVDECCGPISARAVTVMHGVAYWMGPDYRLRAWAPGGAVQVVPCPIATAVTTYAVGDPQARSFIVANRAWQEIWYFYYDYRDPAIDGGSRYVAYSVAESAAAQRPIWFRGAMARRAMFDSELVRALSSSQNSGLVGITAAGEAQLHDCAVSGSAHAWIQSGDQHLDESQRRMMVRGVLPDFANDPGTIWLTLFMRDRPQSAPTVKGPYSLPTTPGSRKDFRASGRIMAIKIHWAVTSWRVGKLLFDVVPLGER